MKKKLLFLIGLAHGTIAVAQHNYQEGIIITSGGDTIKGWIDHKEWERNPVSFRFCDNVDGKNARIYTVKDIVGFEVARSEYFERFPVRISMDKVAPLEDLSVAPDLRSINDTVFLRVVRKGDLNLYAYQDNLKIRYYISKNGGVEVDELVYRRYYRPEIEQGERVVIDKGYQRQLMQAAEKMKEVNTARLSELLLKTDYTLREITKVVDYINGPDNKSYIPASRSKVQFYAGLSLFTSQAKYSGTHDLAKDATEKTSLLPKISAGLDLFTNPNVKKMILRFDFSFASAKNKVTKPMGADGGYVSHSFDQFTIAFCPQVIYNIYNSNKLKVNLGTGISANYSIYSNNLSEQKYTIPGPGGRYNYEQVLEMEPFWFYVPLRAGVMLNNRFDLYAQYNALPSPVANYTTYSVKVSTGQLGMNILFKK